MPRFSLIVATLGRAQELEILLESLAAQQGPDFELIVADQNADDRLDRILSDWAVRMSQLHSWFSADKHLVHVRTTPGLSHARNVALVRSSGEIMAFPDDDCWYPAGLLQWVSEWFAANTGYGILSVGSRDETGALSGNRLSAGADLNRTIVFRASVSYGFFVKRSSDYPLRFDETLGLGSKTPFGSGEDTDFVLTLMARGVRGRFNPERYVGHPAKGHMNPIRGLQYGLGWGRILRKHSLPLQAVAFITFDLIRALVSLVKGDAQKAQSMWAHARGIQRGYVWSVHLVANMERSS